MRVSFPLLLAIFIALHYVCSENTYHPSVGVSFQTHHAQLTPMQDSALLQCAINLPPLPKLNTITKFSVKKAKINDGPLQEMMDATNKLIDDHNVLKDKIYRLNNEVHEHLRSDNFIVKRGIINAGGSVLKWLFGVATTSDLQNFKLKVSKVEQGVRFVHDEVTKQKAYLAKALERTDERFTSLWTTVEENVRSTINLGRITQNLTFQMERNYYTTQKELGIMGRSVNMGHAVNTAIVHILTRMALMESYFNEYTMWLSALEMLQQGFIVPTLVRPSAVKEGLNSIYKSLQEVDSPLKVAIKSVHDVYKLPTAVYSFAEETLYIRMIIPLAVTVSHFKLFKINIIPMPLHNQEKEAYQIMSGEADYFLADLEQRYFYELTREQYLDCATAPGMLCPRLKTIRADSVTSCLVAIFLKLDSLVLSVCSFTVIHASLPSFVMEIGDGSYLLSMKESPQLVCINGTTVLSSIDYSTISVPCGCQIRTDTGMTGMHYCKTEVSQFKKLQPVNFPLVHYFNLTAIMATDKTMFQTPVKPVF